MAAKTRGFGVDWCLPHPKGGFYKRPFTSTTPAASNLIVLLGADGLTWQEIHDEIRYDDEAKAVCQAFIDAGFGDTLASTHVDSPEAP